MFLMLVLPFVSCDKNTEVAVNVELSISRNEIILDPDASVEELVVKASTDWRINDIPQWCGTIRPSYGKAGEWTVRIRGRFYEEKADRSAVLKVVAGDKTETFTLLQMGAKIIDAKLYDSRVPSVGGQVKVNVVSDYETYSVEVVEGTEWLTTTAAETPLNGDIIFSAAQNDTDSDRTATIRFSNS